jgi:hypothetical protein
MTRQTLQDEQIAKYLTADNSVFSDSNANDMRVTQDLNSFGEIIAHAQLMNKKNIYIPCVPHKNNYKQKLSNITPVLGEENFPLKIQFGIRRYPY